MPRLTLVGTNSYSKPSDLAQYLPRGKDSSWDPSMNNNYQERRRGSVSAAGPETESGRLEEEKLPKIPNPSLPIEERLAFLEEKILQLKSTTG